MQYTPGDKYHKLTIEKIIIPTTTLYGPEVCGIITTAIIAFNIVLLTSGETNKPSDGKRHALPL